MPAKLQLMVILGSTRPGRMGDRVAKFMLAQLQSNEAFQVDYVDLAQIDLGFIKVPHHWMPAGTAPGNLEALAKRVATADAYLFVSPEYNHSMSPVLVNFIDHFAPMSYSYKPSAIASYSIGAFGGANSANQLRLLASQVGCHAIRTHLLAPQVQLSLDETGREIGATGKLLVDQASRLFIELEWYARALKTHRDQVSPPPQN
ncbi:hypothetical protein BASA81_008381 [Batrachochytrium salamandrivorans]|nr:hypothetical protein BASA81_008381 [Batrachochytrium salamandrivorans]